VWICVDRGNLLIPPLLLSVVQLVLITEQLPALHLCRPDSCSPFRRQIDELSGSSRLGQAPELLSQFHSRVQCQAAVWVRRVRGLDDPAAAAAGGEEEVVKACSL
jgi:hypothetical protein